MTVAPSYASSEELTKGWGITVQSKKINERNKTNERFQLFPSSENKIWKRSI